MMDRDFTQEAEEELTGEVETGIQSFYILTNEGLPSYVNNDSTYYYYSTINSKYDALERFYSSAKKEIATCFAQIREYDSIYTSVEGSNQLSAIEEFKKQILSVLECLGSPNLGKNIKEVRYNLGRYGDTVLANSIFGDGWAYACRVSGQGFVDIAKYSASAYEHYYYSLITIDENGKIIYDLDAILASIARPAFEITRGEYDAMALAYLDMDEDAMAEFMKRCTVKVGDVEGKVATTYNPYVGEAYSIWEADQEKYLKIEKSLEIISAQTLATIIILDKEYDKNENVKYKETADSYELLRNNIMQKAALFGALYDIRLDGEYQGEYPDLSVKSEPYSKNMRNEDEKSLILVFSEKCNTNWDNDKSFAYKGHSSIKVLPTFDENEITSGQIDYLQNIVQQTYSYDVYDETRDEIFDNLADIPLEKVFHCGVGYAISAMNFYNDYQNAKIKKEIVTDEFGEIKEDIIFSQFGCESIIVEYDTFFSNETVIMYKEGRHTQSRVDKFNEEFSGCQIDMNILFNSTDKVDRLIDNFDSRKKIRYKDVTNTMNYSN